MGRADFKIPPSSFSILKKKKKKKKKCLKDIKTSSIKFYYHILLHCIWEETWIAWIIFYYPPPQCREQELRRGYPRQTNQNDVKKIHPLIRLFHPSPFLFFLTNNSDAPPFMTFHINSGFF